jgi:hypothetical protein
MNPQDPQIEPEEQKDPGAGLSFPYIDVNISKASDRLYTLKPKKYRGKYRRNPNYNSDLKRQTAARAQEALTEEEKRQKRREAYRIANPPKSGTKPVGDTGVEATDTPKVTRKGGRGGLEERQAMTIDQALNSLYEYEQAGESGCAHKCTADEITPSCPDHGKLLTYDF